MLQPRPPVVTIMGHVDHGKTTLLDKIRQSNIAGRESGGITQHIGAYQISFKDKEKKEKKITFIDTPGHAAFSQMRARGAQVTDIAVLVVAADQGVQEQTKESLVHIKEAKIPYLVAITKIDLDKADPDGAKEELAQVEVVCEELGGKIPMVLVSGKTGEGIKELLEMIALMAEVEELKADPDLPFEAVVIESGLDKRRGPVATVLIKNGSLKVGDRAWLGEEEVKIKAMVDDQGKPVEKALPSQPVEVLGFSQVPPVGSILRAEKQTLEELKKEEKEEEKKEEKTDAEIVFGEKEEKLPLVLKADAQGTLEAVENNLPPEVNLIYRGVGEITDSDIFLAQTGRARVIGFRVKVSPAAAKAAKDHQVEVKTFNIIYQLIEEVEKLVLQMMEPGIERGILGRAEIVAQFKIDKKRIAGCRVVEGEIAKALPVTIKRGKEILGETKIATMKQVKEEINLAKQGEEFGASFSPYIDFKEGDVIISHNKEKE